MPASGKILVKSVTAAVFVVLEIAAVGLLKSSSTMQDMWLNRASCNTLAKLWGTGESIRSYFSLRKVNDALAEENFNLRTSLMDAEKALNDIGASSAISEIKDSRFQFQSARVVKISRNSQHNYIILDKGSEDGIVPHSGIISSNGIVGIIDAVDKHYSYGLTLMNSRISVSVRAGRDGIVSPLVWSGRATNAAVLKEFPSQGIIEKGDTVYTSGLSSVFPGEIPVGVVSGEPSRSGIAKNVEVTLFQDFSSLHYVIVACEREAGEISELEGKEELK